jgi:hypothetical protein
MPLIKALMGTAGILALVVLLFFTCWLLAAGCSRAHIVVNNQSGSTISNLVISGSCKLRRSDALPALSEWRTVVPYNSGGRLQLAFVSGGSNYTSRPDAATNLSGACAIFFRIGTGMVVTSEVRK